MKQSIIGTNTWWRRLLSTQEAVVADPLLSVSYIIIIPILFKILALKFSAVQENHISFYSTQNELDIYYTTKKIESSQKNNFRFFFLKYGISHICLKNANICK